MHLHQINLLYFLIFLLKRKLPLMVKVHKTMIYSGRIKMHSIVNTLICLKTYNTRMFTRKHILQINAKCSRALCDFKICILPTVYFINSALWKYLEVASVIIGSCRQAWVKSNQQCSNRTISRWKCSHSSPKKQETDC